ncbi:MAG: hypothetical protein ACK5OB_06340 [Pirellula sp.]
MKSNALQRDRRSPNFLGHRFSGKRWEGFPSGFRTLRIERLEYRCVFAAASFGNDTDVLTLDASMHDHDEADMVADARGWLHCVLPTVPPPAIDPDSNSGSKSSGDSWFTPMGLTVPVFHSNPSASLKIYLDFDGHTVQDTAWNNQNYNGSVSPNPIHAPAYSMDGDYNNFSAAELTSIREVWARVAEDYAPFNVDVTTEYPSQGESIFTEGSRAIRALISTDFDAITKVAWYSNAGGVAYLNSWTWNDASPVWVFANQLAGGNTKYVSEAVSHEVGHAMNLKHDGRISPSEGYYQGHGSGATGWAPIMGVGYYRDLVQWSKGEYPSANNKENDLAIINAKLGTRSDDFGNTAASASSLTVAADGSIGASGVIATANDVDAFQFVTQSGEVSLVASPFEFSTGKANLDVQMTLLNSAGTVVASSNLATVLNATISMTLTKGVYTVLLDGVGRAAVSGDPGYTDYGSLGQYSLSGTVIKNQSPELTVNAGSVSGWEGATLTMGGTWSDPDLGDVVTMAASVGNLVQNPNGTWNWSITAGDQQAPTTVTMTATDDLGAVTSTTFTFEFLNQPPQLTVGQASVRGAVLSTLTNSGTWQDVPGDNVVLAASVGSIQMNSDGTWSWSYQPTSAQSNQSVTVTGTDEDGGSSSVSFTVDALVTVVRAGVYYRGSVFENNGVDAAIDSSIELAKSGSTSQLLGYNNLINSSRGINGLVFDVAGLESTNLTASDLIFRVSPKGAFDEASIPPSNWQQAPPPTAIVVTAGTNTTPSRIRLEWTDNAIANQWLQVRVLANSRTGLIAPQTYYLGHLLGELTGVFSSNRYLLQMADVLAIQPKVGSLANASSRFDINKNGLVQLSDLSLVRSMVGLGILRNITIPAAGSGSEGEGVQSAWPSTVAMPFVAIATETLSPTIGARITSEIFTVEPELEQSRNELPKQNIRDVDAIAALVADSVMAKWTVDADTRCRKRHPWEKDTSMNPQADEKRADDLSLPLAE